MTKDLFSGHSKEYAAYRPGYPVQLFQYILEFVPGRKMAWDCATGNGQAASILADYFEKVVATDISAQQLNNAIQKSNVSYLESAAEQTPFNDNSFDLITVAQAYHWLNWNEFYHEATRVGKPNAVIAIWTYNLIKTEEKAINEIVEYLYRDITGPYWDPARKYVEEEYKTIPFEFSPLPSKPFNIQVTYTREALLGYLFTWSGVQNYIKHTGQSPLSLINEKLLNVWGNNPSRLFNFPLTLKMGRIIK